MPKAHTVHRAAKVTAKKHNPRGQGATERQRTRAMHTGSKAWRLMRLSVLQRDGYTCAVCGRYGDQVDHIDGDSHNNDADNLQTLCLRDHSAKTMREINATARRPA
jgi:5-methylcytosine-specific restriction endonuclease McrA